MGFAKLHCRVHSVIVRAINYKLKHFERKKIAWKCLGKEMSRRKNALAKFMKCTQSVSGVLHRNETKKNEVRSNAHHWL